MTSGRVWGARLAALLAAAIIIPACSAGSSGSGTVGVSKQALWNSNAGVGAQPNGTSVFWHDPSDPQYAGVGGAPVPPDPQDIRTYTRPDIYILGLKHPLMVDLSTVKAPIVIFQENRAFDLLNQFRYNTYFKALGGPPLPPNSNLLDHPGLRQNARANCKHYAVWHPTGPLPAVNAEGDNVAGRLTKSKLTATALAEIRASGPTYKSSDDVAAYWIATYGGSIATPGLLLDPALTNLTVGFWQQGGGTEDFYWTAILAQGVTAIVVTPTLPFGGPGF
jgi:hypothetical protein